MKPEVMFLHRIKLYGAMISLLLFSLGIWLPMADATVLKQADMETGDMSQWQAYLSPNYADKFVNFGIPLLAGGGTYAASAHSTSGSTAASYLQLYYNNYSLSNGFARFYFFVPTGYQASQDSGNTEKLLLLYPIGSAIVNSSIDLNRAILFFQSGSGPTAPLHFSWSHTPTSNSGYISGDMGFTVTRGQWHYVEVNINSLTNTVNLWFDADARTAPRTWTNVGNNGRNGFPDDPYPNSTNSFIINENWSSNPPIQTQDLFIDGAAWGDGAIGDTYGLLGNQPPSDTTPPAAPSGLSVK